MSDESRAIDHVDVDIEQILIDLPFRDLAQGRAIAAELARSLRNMPVLPELTSSMRIESLQIDLPPFATSASDAQIAAAVVSGIHRALAQAIGRGRGSSMPHEGASALFPRSDEGAQAQPTERSIEPARPSGTSLPAALRAPFEQHLEQNFSDVRVHTGQEASALAGRFEADALTINDDIFFRSERFRPDTDRGKRLLAHELTHVAQQRRGGSPAGKAALEAEADASASAIGTGRHAPLRHTASRDVPLASPDKDKEREATAPTPNDSPFPGFSQGDYSTCGAASLVSALMIWDNEKRDPAAPHHLVETACHIILTHLANHRHSLITQWDKVGLKGGLTGEKLYTVIRDSLVAVRDKARVPGSKLAEIDYQTMGAALYALYNDKTHGGLTLQEIGNLVAQIGLSTGSSDSAQSLSDLFALPALTRLAPGRIAQMSWFAASKPNATGNFTLTAHTFLVGRLKEGDWFLSDQGSKPPLDLRASTLGALELALNVAQATNQTQIFRGTPPVTFPPALGSVRVLGDSSGVDRAAIAEVLRPGQFLAEVDAGAFTIGDKIFAWDFAERKYDYAGAVAALPPGPHGGVIVEIPEGVFNVYKTNPVRPPNMSETDIDDSDSADGKLSKASHIYYHAWLILGDSSGRRSAPFKVY